MRVFEKWGASKYTLTRETKTTPPKDNPENSLPTTDRPSRPHLLPTLPQPPNTRTTPTIPNQLILTLALIQTRFQASYRDLLFCYAPLAFPDLPLPALGTLVYRFQQLILRAQDRLNHLQAWLAPMGIALETPTTETPYARVDGTGIGYATPFDAPFRRGAEIRRLRSHVKAVVVSYWQGGYCWVVGGH